MNARTQGLEASTNFQINPDLAILASYSYLDMYFYRDTGGKDTISGLDAGVSPKHSFNLLTRYNLQENLYVDTNLSRRSALPTYHIGDQTRVDLTVTWKPIEAVELSLAGQNLTDSYHQEFSPGTFGIPTEIPRSVLGRMTVSF